MIAQHGIKVVWGVPAKLKRIDGLPPGRIKLRLRNNSVGKIYATTPNRIRCFVILDIGERWELGPEQGMNFRLGDGVHAPACQTPSE